jgi:hypothetical protein
MALQFGTTLRNARADALTATIGASCKLRLYTGAAPANCGTAASGTQLAELTGNATFAPSASGGVLTLNSVTGANASAAGTAGYFRIYNSAGTVCHMQGTVDDGTTGADLALASTLLAIGDPIAITSWTITEGGA